MKKNQHSIFWLSSTLGLVYIFVFLNYPSFFTWNPSNSATPILGWLQFLSSFAWFCAAVTPSVIWAVGSSFTKAKSFAYLTAALIWPGALVVLHSHLFLTSGNASLAYLVNYPIFILTDLIAPIIYVQMWRKFRTQKTQSALVTNNFLFDSTKADQS